MTVDDVELRGLVPRVLSVLVRRGADFATAEDATQEALVRALSAWRETPPADPTAPLSGYRALGRAVVTAVKARAQLSDRLKAVRS